MAEFSNLFGLMARRAEQLSNYCVCLRVHGRKWGHALWHSTSGRVCACGMRWCRAHAGMAVHPHGG